MQTFWRHIAESEQAKKAGLKIEVQEINGGVPLNESVADGTVDANAFQSIGYLQGFNEANSNKLVPVGTTYIEPMGFTLKGKITKRPTKRCESGFTRQSI